MGVSEVAVRIATLLTMLAVARFLGPSTLGQLATAQAILAFATVLSDGGLTTLSQRSIVRDRNAEHTQVSVTLATQLALALTLAMILLGLVLTLPFGSAGTRSLVIALSPILFASALNLYYVLQARENFLPLALIRASVQFLGAAVSVILILAAHSAVPVAITAWATVLLGDLGCLWYLRKRGLRLVRVKVSACLSLLRRGWPYLATAILGQIILNLDIVVLNIFTSDSATGQYAASYRIVLVAIGLIGLAAAVVFPEMVRRQQRDLTSFRHLVGRLIHAVSAGGALLALLMTLFAREICSLLYGSQYPNSPFLLSILALSIPISYANGILGQALIACDREHDYLRGIAVTVVVTIAGLGVLVPTYGPKGAALIVLLGELVTLAIFSRAGSTAGLGRPGASALYHWLAVVLLVSGVSLVESLGEERMLLARLMSFVICLAIVTVGALRTSILTEIRTSFRSRK